MIKKEEPTHYDCEYFEAIDDGISRDCYCHFRKEWFWIVEETPLCDNFKGSCLE